MKPKEALQILDQISAMVQMNRTDHSRAIEAVKVLSDLVNHMDNMNKAKKPEFSKDIKKAD